MVLKIVRSNSPIILFFFLILTAALWYPAFSGDTTVRFSFDTYQMPLYKYLYALLADKYLLQVFVVLFVILLQCFFLLKFNRQYILLDKQNYTPAIFFIIITSSFIQLQRINPGVFAAFFIILVLDQLFSSYREKYILNRLFLAGFFVAIASLFYSFSIVFLVVIWIALILLRSFSLREWFVPILGVIFVYLFVFGYYYISDSNSIQSFLELAKNSFFHPVTVTHYSLAYYIYFGFIGLMILMGSFALMNKLPKRKIYIRKYFEIFFWTFLVGVVLFFLKQGVSVEMIYIIAFPVSLLLASYVNSIRSGVFGNILLYIFIGLIALVYYTNG